MAIQFPLSPTINQVYTEGGLSWTWNGSSWQSTVTGIIGSVGGNITGNLNISGDVGIGTTSPTKKLDVIGEMRIAVAPGTASAYGRINGGDQYHSLVMRGNISGSTTQTVVPGDSMTFAEYGGVFRFKELTPASNNDLMTLTPSGLGIGIANPSQKLEVAGTGTNFIKVSSSTNDVFRGIGFGNLSDSTLYGSVSMNLTSGELRYNAGYSGWGGYHTFFTNGSQRMSIESNGNVNFSNTTNIIKETVSGTTTNKQTATFALVGTELTITVS